MNQKTTLGFALVAAIAMTGCIVPDGEADVYHPQEEEGGAGGRGGDGVGGAGEGGSEAEPSGTELVYSSRLVSNEMVLECPDLVEVDLDPLTVESNGSEYFFLLNVPETWVTAESIGGYYCIAVDDEPVACTEFNSAHAGQRVPVTVVGAKALYHGTHTVKAMWACSHSGAELRIGTHHESWLVAMRAEGAEYAARPIGSPVLSLSDSVWADIDVSPMTLTVDSAGDDYLFALNVPQTWTSAAGANAHFRILVDDEPLAGGVYTSATTNQRVPITLFGAASLPAGTHRVRAQVRGPGGGVSVNIGSDFPALLTAVPVPQGIAHDERPNMEQALAGGTGDIDIAPLSVDSSGGDHLFILNAADNWMSTSSSWANFFLSVDDEVLSGGVHSGEAQQRIPTTVIAVKNLSAGPHSLKALWNTDYGMTANQGLLYPTRLIGL